MGTSLSNLKPADAWKPASDGDWNLKWAAHLYRRAAFGFPPADGQSTSWELLQRAVKQGRDACVEQLLAGGEGQKPFNELMDSLGESIAKLKVARFESLQPEKLQGWWLYRMFYTPHPLLERCTLFWHDHFATSLAKVGRSELMFEQNKLLRRHALGKFEPLLSGISRDPAMLIWLDSNSNIKGRPNENFAREIMELFSLGVGNYTEGDIREAARALTGWSTGGGKFLFNESLHDDGAKTLLGETGRWGGDDVVRILLKQPATARFLVRKIYNEFLSEADAPPDALIETLADEFRKSDYDIKACLRTILRSRLFYSEHAYRQRIKSPVEYVIGLTRSFDTNLSPERLAKAMDGLGQSLFAPPNVKGWDGGQAWLNSATLLARHNLAARLVGGHDGSFRNPIHLAKFIKKMVSGDISQQTDFLLKLFVSGDVSPQARARLLKYATRPSRQLETQEETLRDITHTILLMPEYQLA